MIGVVLNRVDVDRSSSDYYYSGYYQHYAQDEKSSGEGIGVSA